MTLAGAATRNALSNNPKRILLRDLDGQSRTGGQILSNVDRVAGALLRHCGAGCRIGLWYWNSFAAVEAFLATEWVGGARLPVDPGVPVPEAAAIFHAGKVDAILTDRDHAAEFDIPVLVHDDVAPIEANPVWPGIDFDPDKTLFLYPRAVNNGRLFAIPLSYGNWEATMETNISLFKSGRYGDWTGDDECFLSSQQIMHGTGFMGTFPFLRMGLPQVLARKFDADRILKAVERYGITSTMLVPAMLTKLADAAEKRPEVAKSLRHILYGGGPIHLNEIRRALDRLGDALVQVYGRVEGGWPISILDTNDHQSIANGDDELGASCGRSIREVEIDFRPSLASATDRGELLVRSAMVVGDYADPNGWCSLGDIVRRDKRGYLFHEGRLDRMINTGYHVYPEEIEEAIARVPGVASVKVVGETDEKWGETVVAYLVPGSERDKENLVEIVKEFLEGKLAKYKIPRIFHIIDGIE